ncbi:MAG: hypothetical protein U0354_19780 [Candidatus Sericytochromatia bacterium]
MDIFHNYIKELFPYFEDKISIKYGIINNMIDNPYKSTPYYSISKKQFYINIPNISKYLIKSSEEILIEPYLNTSDEDIKFFLIETVIPIYFLQNGFICLKGTAIVKDNKIIIITGYGFGKSTLTYKLIQKYDYRLITDNYIVLNNKKIINSFNMSIWGDIISKIEYNKTELKPIRKNLDKYFILHDKYNLSGNEKILDIYILNKHFSDKVYINDVKNIDKPISLFNCLMGETLINSNDSMKEYFSKLVNISNDSNIKIIFSSNKMNELDNIYEIFEQIKINI